MLVWRAGWRPVVLPKFLPRIWGLTMAYVERRERKKGVRYRGLYKAADGRYRSAGTFSTAERALAVAEEAERHAEVTGGAAGGLDPAIRATRTIKEYAPLFLRHHQVEGNTKDTYADTLRLHVIPFLGGCRLAETDRTVARNFITALVEAGRSANTIRQAKVALGAMFGMAVADGYLDYNPFHDVKIPKVPGRRAIKIATPEQYLKVRGCLPTKSARVFSTLLVSSGIRFCEAIGLQPADFDFEAGILEVARSVVKVSRQHHPQGKTFLVRDYTKNGQTRRLKLDRAVVELVRGHVAEHGIGEMEVIFPAELVVPPRRTKPRLTEEQLRALGDCEPVGGQVYRARDHGRVHTSEVPVRGVPTVGPGLWPRDGCGSGVPSPLATFGADGRSLAMPTSPIWTRRAGTGSGLERSRRAESRSSRPPTRSGIRTPRG